MSNEPIQIPPRLSRLLSKLATEATRREAAAAAAEQQLRQIESDIIATGKQYRIECIDAQTKAEDCKHWKAAIKRLALNYRKVYESLALINKHKE